MFMNINENCKNKVKMMEEKKIPLLFIYRISHILAAMYPRPINMVTNVSLGSGLSSEVSHMQIIQVVYK